MRAVRLCREVSVQYFGKSFMNLHLCCLIEAGFVSFFSVFLFAIFVKTSHYK